MTDLRAKEWYISIAVSGSQDQIRLDGLNSVGDLAKELLPLLLQAKPKKLMGGKTITITLSDKQQESQLSAIERNVLGEIEDESLERQPGETWDQLYNRFIERGFPEPAAAFCTNDLFGYPQDDETQRWISDPKVKQWSRLQVNQTAFAEAMKGEYEELSRWIKQQYPKRAAQITFKVAI